MVAVFVKIKVKCGFNLLIKKTETFESVYCLRLI